MSAAVDLCEAIVALLNDEDGEFSMEFEAKRRVAPYTKPDDEALKTVQVYVLTNTKSAFRQSRAEFGRVYKPVVVVQKRLTAGISEGNELAEADLLQTLVDEIEDAIDGTEDLAGCSFRGFDEEQDRDAYGLEPMRDARVFAVAITLEYTD